MLSIFLLFLSDVKRAARFDFVDLIIYQRHDSLKNLAKKRYTTLKKMGLYLHYRLVFAEYYIDLNCFLSGSN